MLLKSIRTQESPRFRLTFVQHVVTIAYREESVRIGLSRITVEYVAGFGDFLCFPDFAKLHWNDAWKNREGPT
jgi:hypothetical protein